MTNNQGELISFLSVMADLGRLADVRDQELYGWLVKTAGGRYDVSVDDLENLFDRVCQFSPNLPGTALNPDGQHAVGYLGRFVFVTEQILSTPGYISEDAQSFVLGFWTGAHINEAYGEEYVARLAKRQRMVILHLLHRCFVSSETTAVLEESRRPEGFSL